MIYIPDLPQLCSFPVHRVLPIRSKILSKRAIVWLFEVQLFRHTLNGAESQIHTFVDRFTFDTHGPTATMFSTWDFQKFGGNSDIV